MMLKVGDRVRVRKDLNIAVLSEYLGNGVNGNMIEKAGKTFTVSEISSEKGINFSPREDKIQYKLKEDSGHWWWTERTLELVEEDLFE